MFLSLSLLAVALVLIVTGVALWSIPAALIAGGVTLAGIALFIDFDRKAGKP